MLLTVPASSMVRNVSSCSKLTELKPAFYSILGIHVLVSQKSFALWYRMSSVSEGQRTSSDTIYLGFFETGSFNCLELVKLARLADQKASEIFLSPSSLLVLGPQALATRPGVFYMGSRD